MQRQLHDDVGSLAQTALDSGVAAEDLGPLSDTLQTEMASVHAVHLKPDAPIPNLDPKLIVVLH